MAFEGLTEQLKNTFTNIKDKIAESSLAQKAQEKYQNLNPSQQRLVFLVGIVIFGALVVYFPMEHYLGSSQFNSEFEDKRALTKSLIKSHREVNHLPDLPAPQSSDNVKAIIDTQLKEMNLVPEQIKYINITAGNSKIIPLNKIQYGIEVSVNKLNLKQITNLGSKLQAIHPSLKLKDLILTANKEDGRYQDGTFKLVALNIPKYIAPTPEPEPTKKSKKSTKPKDGEAE